MDPQVAGIIVALISLVGVIVTVKYKDYRKENPKKKDRVELFFERYDIDRENDKKDMDDLRERLETAEDDLKEAKKKLEKALQLIDEKDGRISKLEIQVKQEKAKYTKLLRRFNALKSRYEKKETSTTP